MNEIERAIKAMENIAEYWTCRPSERQAAQLALTALREKQEREKGCVWCNKNLRFECYLIDDEGHTASIENNVVQTVIAEFCPVCGRPLE